jgi:hypothetical protein
VTHVDRLLDRPLDRPRLGDGVRREPRLAAAAAMLTDGPDYVPHADWPATYIPLVKVSRNERTIT